MNFVKPELIKKPKPNQFLKKKNHPKLQMDDVEIWVCRVIARAVLLQQVLPLICINLLL